MLGCRGTGCAGIKRGLFIFLTHRVWVWFLVGLSTGNAWVLFFKKELCWLMELWFICGSVLSPLPLGFNALHG
jgi:hypothetical protein